MVLNEICDDYENVDQTILPNVARQGIAFGLAVDRGEVVNTLAGLLADLAKAFDLTGPKPNRTRSDAADAHRRRTSERTSISRIRECKFT